MNSEVNRAYQAVLFDLDGTLVDSVIDIAIAVDQTFMAFGKEKVSEESVRGWIGNGVERLVHRALTHSMDLDAPEDEFKPVVEYFYDAYEKQSGCESKLYQGVAETLELFSLKKFKMVCITNKSRRFTIPLLEKLGIAEYFSVVVCGDDLANKKPHPEPLIYSAKQLNLKPHQCLMIGDSANDVSAANSAEVDIICVDYGYAQGVNLAELKIKTLVSEFKDIEKYV